MRPKKEREKILIPPADIILALLNNDSDKETEILDFYDGYIHTAAMESTCTYDGISNSYFLNEDLLQEIRFEFIKSLPVLRKKLINSILLDKSDEISIVFVINKD